jgi:hypothetical protein
MGTSTIFKNSTIPSFHPGLAPAGASFASSKDETPATIFSRLDKAALSEAGRVLIAGKALETAWDELLPILDKMQSHLSQRGIDRTALEPGELPTWSEWWATFRESTGICATLRKVQKKLKRYRAPKTDFKKPSSTERMTNQQQRQVLVALLLANDVAAAVESGQDPRDAVLAFRSAVAEAGRIEQLLENLPNDDRISESVAVTSKGEKAALSCGWLSTQPSQPERLIKSGDSSGLANTVIESHGSRIRSAMEGLEPLAAVKFVNQFVQKLVQSSVQRLRRDGEIKVTVEYVPADPPALRGVG